MRFLIIDVFNKDVTALDDIDHAVASNTDNIAKINEQVEEIYKNLEDGWSLSKVSPLQNKRRS